MRTSKMINRRKSSKPIVKGSSWVDPADEKKQLSKHAIIPQFSEPQLNAVKTRLECRGGETGPRYFLEVTAEGKVQGCDHGDGDNTLLYLIPVGLRWAID